VEFKLLHIMVGLQAVAASPPTLIFERRKRIHFLVSVLVSVGFASWRACVRDYYKMAYE
jgi:hypothetical protein